MRESERAKSLIKINFSLLLLPYGNKSVILTNVHKKQKERVHEQVQVRFTEHYKKRKL